MEQKRDILTPEQAADYLQVDRETIYRYIRQGKLVASKLGRTYRIPKGGIDLLLRATRTRMDISLIEFTEVKLPILYEQISSTKNPRKLRNASIQPTNDC